MNIVAKGFCTSAGWYVYDRSTNSIISVSKKDYDLLMPLVNGRIPAKGVQTLTTFRKEGLFQDNTVSEMRHPATDYLEHYTSHRLGYLVLQVTQQCNLRCKYCVYGGLYENRTHMNKTMSFETAKKAMDFYLERAGESDTVGVSFYGGEPLLAFDLIKQCIEYFKNSVEGRKIFFSMTTNGTLLTKYISNYLVKENVRLLISLDGDKNAHNANRIFENGGGSFDLIMENVRRIKEDFPAYGRQIQFNTVLNPKMDLGCVTEFFDTDDVMRDNNVLFSLVNSEETTQKWEYEDEFYLIRMYEYVKLLLAMVGKISFSTVSKLVILSRSRYIQNFGQLHNNYPLPEKFHHGGPCIPGHKKVFVNVDGTLYPCEKCVETNPYYKIGTLKDGFDLNRIAALMNNGVTTQEECLQCWALRHCTICSAQLTLAGKMEPTKSDILPRCELEKKRVLDDFIEMCVLREFGYREDALQ